MTPFIKSTVWQTQSDSLLLTCLLIWLKLNCHRLPHNCDNWDFHSFGIKIDSSFKFYCQVHRTTQGQTDSVLIVMPRCFPASDLWLCFCSRVSQAVCSVLRGIAVNRMSRVSYQDRGQLLYPRDLKQTACTLSSSWPGFCYLSMKHSYMLVFSSSL